ncbi:ATP-binding SpoIIE family protein phosphatase [Streptomyces daqingensis]|uniref:ATP-binding SpoIIE family protein phosphatase n=1 Tax=Streptomyces daqingensis TaxID=1472640 RepID=UPI00166905F0|nr:SpoIIE family protein phosphatase [Streptomyces daqingensis]
MGSTSHRPGRGLGFCLPYTVTVVLDHTGTVSGWSQEASELLGYGGPDVIGKPFTDLVAEPPPRGAVPEDGFTQLRHSDGTGREVALRVTPLDSDGYGSGQTGWMVLATPAETAAQCEQGVAIRRALAAQPEQRGMAVHDTDLNVLSTNVPPGAPELGGVLYGPDAEAFRAVLREATTTGRPVFDREAALRTDGRRRTVSQSVLPLSDVHGDRSGVLSFWRDTTDQTRMRKHLELLRESAVRISASLDVRRVAQDLADILVPGLGDLATVELAESVLIGDDPPDAGRWDRQRLVRVAGATTGPWPEGLLAPGTPCPPLPDSEDLRTVRSGEAVVTDRRGAVAAVGEGQQRLFVPPGGHSLAVAPIRARGLALGLVSVWRTDQTDAITEDERVLLTEICSRASISLDNARRYTREHRSAGALQQRLLPRPATSTMAAETAGSYRPAGGGNRVGGDWFDAIPLPGLRTALVVGDVTGHGLYAAAAMGRLRTAIQTLAALELDPDDLLHHVDDLVHDLAAEADPEQGDTGGATCLVAVWDPINQQCTMASAGHPPPVLVTPDGDVRLLDLPPGPPLGVGGMPFESHVVRLEPGSVLALYTDGLVCDDGDLERGMRRLCDALQERCRNVEPLQEVGPALLRDLLEGHQRNDDVALLLARTRAISPWHTMSWTLPAEAESVGQARSAAVRQLAAWGLGEIAFSVELVVSELVTNAVRYAGGPVGLRLIRSPDALIVEVTDPSSTAPRLRRARETDEGGRGLWLVAQMTTRWGSRYSREGNKTIWTEQPLTPEPLVAPLETA